MDSLTIFKLSEIVIGIGKVMAILTICLIAFSYTYKSIAKAKPMIDLAILTGMAGGLCWGIDKFLIT